MAFPIVCPKSVRPKECCVIFSQNFKQLAYRLYRWNYLFIHDRILHENKAFIFLIQAGLRDKVDLTWQTCYFAACAHLWTVNSAILLLLPQQNSITVLYMKIRCADDYAVILICNFFQNVLLQILINFIFYTELFEKREYSFRYVSLVYLEPCLKTLHNFWDMRKLLSFASAMKFVHCNEF